MPFKGHDACITLAAFPSAPALIHYLREDDRRDSPVQPQSSFGSRGEGAPREGRREAEAPAGNEFFLARARGEKGNHISEENFSPSLLTSTRGQTTSAFTNKARETPWRLDPASTALEMLSGGSALALCCVQRAPLRRSLFSSDRNFLLWLCRAEGHGGCCGAGRLPTAGQGRSGKVCGDKRQREQRETARSRRGRISNKPSLFEEGLAFN